VPESSVADLAASLPGGTQSFDDETCAALLHLLREEAIAKLAGELLLYFSSYSASIRSAGQAGRAMVVKSTVFLSITMDLNICF
jgi:hypothetical protein